MVRSLIHKNEYWIKWIVIFFVCAIAMILFYRCYLDDIIPESAMIVCNKDDEQVIHDLHKEDVLSQQFVSNRDFDFITLDFANHDMVLNGNLVVQVFNSKSELVNYTETAIAGIASSLAINIDGGGEKGEIYTVTITNDNVSEDGIGIYGYRVSADSDEYVVYNGTIQQEYAISIGIYKNTSVFSTISKMVLLVIIIGFAITILLTGYYTYSEKTFTTENKFLFISIPFALCMLLMLNNYAYDEPSHQAVAYHYSNIVFATAENDAHKQISVRQADLEYQSEFGKYNCRNEQIISLWNRMQDFEWFTDKNDMVIWDDPNYVINGPAFLAYFPYIFGIIIARIVHMGAFPMWMLCRVLGFLFFEIGCYYAIKKTPIAKGTFAFAASSPMAIYAATAITYDATTIWVTFLLLAYIFTWWRRRLDAKEWIVVVLSSVVLLGCKGGVYLPVLILIFAVSVKRWNLSGKKVFALLSFFSISVIAFILLYGEKLKQYLYCNLDDSESWYAYGSGYAFVYPVNFLKMLVKTIPVCGEMYLGQLFGYRAQWMDDTVSFAIIFVFAILLVLISVPTDDNEKLSIKEKLFLGIFLLLEYIGMHIILLQNTKVGLDYVYGVQGRYFVAFMPLIFLLFNNNALIRKAGAENELYLWYIVAQIMFMSSYIGLYLTA